MRYIYIVWNNIKNEWRYRPWWQWIFAPLSIVVLPLAIYLTWWEFHTWPKDDKQLFGRFARPR